MAIRPTLETWVLDALISARPGAGRGASHRARAAAIAGTLARLGVEAVARDAPGYPSGWNDLPDPPAAMFSRGRPLPEPARAVAMVGSRAATPYGLGIARRMAADLAGLGYTVVSGLARGIDAAAHRGALEAGGCTVAVLPSGIDRVTPSHHRALADAIAERGTLVSERAFGGPRFRGEFVRRNRLIAALAGATVVVEAAEASGALTTAEVGRTLGRAVLAVPGDVDRPASRGTHGLIRAGAILCENTGHVIQAIEAWSGGRTDGAPRAPEHRLLAAVGAVAATVETIAGRAGLPVAATLAGLLALQWAGAVEPRPGQKWIRVRR